jgi:hypothetical protein
MSELQPQWRPITLKGKEEIEHLRRSKARQFVRLFILKVAQNNGSELKTSALGIISGGYMGLVCGYTLLLAPASSLSSACIAKRRLCCCGAWLRTMVVIKVMVMRWVQGSPGIKQVLFVWALQVRGWLGQRAWVHQAKVTSLAGLRHMRGVAVEFAWQRLAPAALGKSRYSSCSRCCSEHSYVEW